MIIFGTRGITTSPESGQFHCPVCRTNMPFRCRRIRRFFTLYFIPIIPLNKLGEYIECQQCQGTFDLQVLEFDPQQEAQQIEANYHRTMRQVMISMLLADGVIDDSEVAELITLIEEMTDRRLGESDVRAEIDQIQALGGSIIPKLVELGNMLNDHGKEKVLEGAYRIAAADGEYSPEEEQLMSEIGGALALSDSHYRGVMATLISGAKIEAPRLPDDNSSPPPLPGR